MSMPSQPTCELVRLARERHARDLETAKQRGLWFDHEAAERAVQFFHRYLRHSKGEWAGRRFLLSPWQEHDIIRPLFGWKREDGTRRFRTAYIEIPRKNGKSTLAAGIGVLLFAGDNEPGAEVYSVATKRDQARIIHREAISMVQSSPQLLRWCKIVRDNISLPRLGARYEPLSSDYGTLDGLNVHGALVDEVHAHTTGQLWHVLESGTSSRRQPLTLGITTAGLNRSGICWELHELARRILQGVFEDDSFFAYITTIDEGDNPFDPEAWAKANPNLGVSKKLDYLEAQAKRAREIPSMLTAFKQKDLNVWVSHGRNGLNMELWAECGRIAPPTEEELVGVPCWGGLDLASVQDLAAFVLVFQLDGGVALRCRFWCPEEGIVRRSQKDHVPYVAWRDLGYLKPTPGARIMDSVIIEDVLEDCDRYNVRGIAFDRWGANNVTTQLEKAGVEMVAFGQGFGSMKAPSAEFEGLLADRALAHGNNPILNWMADNVEWATDPAGSQKPDKGRSREKIDGIVALIMALGLMLVQHNLEDTTSPYEDHGLEYL